MLANEKQELLDRAQKPQQEALRLHRFYRGKLELIPKCCVRGLADFAIWYTPGVAEPCKAIKEEKALVYDYTNKGNTIAIVTDGTRILSLGDIGPEAGLPVMEGKALLFKYLGGVDAVPICLGTKDPEAIIAAVKWLEPSFGAVSLEDIAQPKCFRILEALRRELHIPVWHDDQQGTATVVLAGLINALKVVGKRIDEISLAMIGAGAANVAIARLLFAYGVRPEKAVIVDSRGILHRGRKDLEENQAIYVDKWHLCQITNAEGRIGGIAEALKGTDVCVSFAAPGPNVIRPEWVAGMATEAIVFACANPVPEIWPWEAKEAGARVVATGRSDFPNQVNNSIGFPGIFRGALDVRASAITDEMCIAAAEEIAGCVGEQLSEELIVPTMDDLQVPLRIAAAVGMKAQEQGVARIRASRHELYRQAAAAITRAREMFQALSRSGFVKAPPEDQPHEETVGALPIKD